MRRRPASLTTLPESEPADRAAQADLVEARLEDASVDRLTAAEAGGLIAGERVDGPLAAVVEGAEEGVLEGRRDVDRVEAHGGATGDADLLGDVEVDPEVLVALAL